MKWKLSKEWGVPIDSPLIENLHPAQLSLYGWLISQDEEKEEELWRDRLEYIVLFFNGEAVQKIREFRKQQSEENSDEFEQVLEKQFGRGLSGERSEMSQQPQNDDLDIIRVVEKDGSIKHLQSSFAKIDTEQYNRE